MDKRSDEGSAVGSTSGSAPAADGSADTEPPAPPEPPPEPDEDAPPEPDERPWPPPDEDRPDWPFPPPLPATAWSLAFAAGVVVVARASAKTLAAVTDSIATAGSEAAAGPVLIATLGAAEFEAGVCDGALDACGASLGLASERSKLMDRPAIPEMASVGPTMTTAAHRMITSVVMDRRCRHAQNC